MNSVRSIKGQDPSRAHIRTPPAPGQRAVADDWARLSRGDLVILENSRELVAGCVDAISLDASVLWLQLEQGRGRRLFLQTEGYAAFRAIRSPLQNVEGVAASAAGPRGQGT
jgi:hypothetical protein